LAARDDLLEDLKLVAHGLIAIKVEFDKQSQPANFLLLSIRSDSENRIRQPAVGDGKVPWPARVDVRESDLSNKKSPRTVRRLMKVGGFFCALDASSMNALNL
jgi:hypothetical protein